MAEKCSQFERLLVMGDLNLLDHPNEKVGGLKVGWKDTKVLRNFMSDVGLLDLHFDGPAYTWSNHQANNLILERLDRALATGSWTIKFPKAAVLHLPILYGDHAPILLLPLGRSKLEKEEKPWRYEYWWSKEPSYGTKFKEIWAGSKEVDTLESKLEKIQNSLSTWAKDDIKHWRKKKKECSKELKKIQLQCPSPQLVWRQKTLRENYAKALEQEEHFWQQRSKQLWLHDKDRNTRYHHLFALKRRRRNSIRWIIRKDGKPTVDKDEISEEFRSFYKDLYSGQQQNFGIPTIFPEEIRLSDAEKEFVSSPPSRLDIREALFRMKPFKAPGPDIFPPGFFQLHWNDIGEDIVKIVSQAFDSGWFPQWLNHTWLTLIPKLECPSLPSQFRPISLSNTVYKIIARLAASKLKAILNRIISSNQSAFLRGRLITDNIMVAREIFHSLARGSQRSFSMAIKLDMEKAFDKVDWHFILNLLSQLDFPPSFIHLIKTCITTPSFQVLVNGEPSEAFTPSRGIRQGCFNKSSCKDRSANQDITLFGLLLIIALGLVLLILYNFSDQMLSTREREQAKSREAAARSARETAQARERWKSAKDAAKKHAVGLQTQLSRTFSRKRSIKQSDTSKGIGNKFDAPIASTGPSSSATSAGKKNEPSNLTKMMRSLEENPDSEEGFNFSIGDKNLKKAPRGRQMHTRSQIFKYAYGQIEREKALQQQNKNLTFSGLISMATDTEIRTRPVIEVAFKDLTISLKGKNKTLMRCVTGKLMPGRVTAVMGPSGAGKTTFLSALAGKITGCDMSGLILINGQIESMTSYKKIIGFVPQDDIVHGNLTVEENLWFSARCRLPADMSKADKVLVVERVIESLGLQAIRDSLVGTVEKRGISGGQRKRVNVGLEMVMEPSLLILDEPTTGLDSSSSQLLLKALRREALEGVNITLVLHQPSYTLFKMFDDLVLLAKGGLTVYHGSVKKVEEYFSGLGINVPDRVNPPDYFIDILEGIVKPNASSGINYKQLPIKWMQHNGYPVPPDMLHNISSSDTLNGGSSVSIDNSVSENPSVGGEIWDDAVEHKQDNIEHDYSQSKDLSNRITPGVLRQYRYFLGRVGKQRLREARIQFVDFLILCLAGICLGTLAKVSDETFGSLGYTYTVIAVSLLCKIGALRSFLLDKLHYRRESASGMSSLAYFLAKDTIDNFNTVIKPIVYLSMFYFFNNPRSSIADNYVILVSLVYCVTGIAYWFAIFFQPGTAQLWSVLLPVVLTLIATQDKGSTAKYLANFSYTKWALEAFVISNAERYPGVWLVTRCGALIQRGYNIGEWGLCIVILVLYGIAFRLIAFFCLITFKKK